VLQVCACLEPPDWAALLESDPVARSIARDVERAVSIGLSGRYWRARAFHRGLACPSPEDFGAPQPGKQPEGRYNPGGARVLYLASDARTAAAECSGQSASTAVWVQEFALDFPDLRAIRLDLDLEQLHPHLHYLLLDSEYLPDLAADFDNVRNPYRATHFLMYLCGQLGIAGVEYPSIRTGSGEAGHPKNLVLLTHAVPFAELMAIGEPTRPNLGIATYAV